MADEDLGEEGFYSYSWDAQKDQEHIMKRGVGFSHIVPAIFKGRFAIMWETEYPEQARAIGKVGSEFWTLVFEEYEDDYGKLIWCSNFWKSEPEEVSYGQDRGVF